MATLRAPQRVLSIPSVPARSGLMRMVSVTAAIAAILLATSAVPRLVFAQGGTVKSLKWQGKVTYKEKSKSPKSHRVKTLQARFEVTAPILPSTGGTAADEWRNVTVAYADSGRWHLDESDLNEWTGPATDGWWDIRDSLKIPSAQLGKLKASELHAQRSNGKIEEIKLPTLPVVSAGSIVLVQPSNVRFQLKTVYNKAQDIIIPKVGRDKIDVYSNILGKQPPHVAGEGITVDDESSEEYAGLPPETVQMMKMMEAMTEGAEGESEDDQVALMALKMDGFIEYDGNPIVGSRQWTTSNDNPGDYGEAMSDSLMTLTHEMTWEFVPVPGK